MNSCEDEGEGVSCGDDDGEDARMKVKCAITLLREATRKQRRDKARAVSPVLPPNTNTRGYPGSNTNPGVTKGPNTSSGSSRDQTPTPRVTQGPTPISRVTQGPPATQGPNTRGPNNRALTRD